MFEKDFQTCLKVIRRVSDCQYAPMIGTEGEATEKLRYATDLMRVQSSDGTPPDGSIWCKLSTSRSSPGNVSGIRHMLAFTTSTFRLNPRKPI
ncbi:hypothetical protein [Sphingomonas sp. PAMC 26617]|uniref:hypothetical protein n=1 Tax=Sphingomonas sp. PAMC 26617 TaxID=1112216 RepID=UPI00028981FE|nr:hypothetical protein [Sphingomonas sp. PAMC 26617]